MFEVKYSDDLEARFQSLAKDHGTTYAFHGSSVENFHSIVHNGLLNIFNKVSNVVELHMLLYKLVYPYVSMHVHVNWCIFILRNPDIYSFFLAELYI